MSDLHVVRRGGGTGPTLVFSHALGLDHTMWTAVADRFADTHPVLLYDHRGHGRSAAFTEGWTLDDLVEDAAALIRAHAQGPVVFVGLSMGGMVAQGLAIRHPALLRGAVLAHTVARYAEPARQAWAQRIETVRASGMAAVVDTVVARYLGERFRAKRPEVAAALRAQLLNNDPVAYMASCRAIAQVDWLAELPTVRCPVLVVAGRHDIGAPVGEAERIVAALAQARLEVLEHSAHLGPVEEPVSFIAAVDRFLHALG
jgi:3-oxoadipate enol-lactonase